MSDAEGGHAPSHGIPIATLSIGYSALPLLARKSTILENVNVLSFGATAGIVVGGSVFVMPAVYILELKSHSSFLQIFLVPVLGAVLGVLFLIPFRRYFVADMHGKLPFPEATATTEILVAGDRGGGIGGIGASSSGLPRHGPQDEQAVFSHVQRLARLRTQLPALRRTAFRDRLAPAGELRVTSGALRVELGPRSAAVLAR